MKPKYFVVKFEIIFLRLIGEVKSFIIFEPTGYILLYIFHITK